VQYTLITTYGSEHAPEIHCPWRVYSSQRGHAKMVRAGTVANLDSSWYRSVNEFARDTGWAHGEYANRG
jgi:hypothetical protein